MSVLSKDLRTGIRTSSRGGRGGCGGHFGGSGGARYSHGSSGGGRRRSGGGGRAATAVATAAAAAAAAAAATARFVTGARLRHKLGARPRPFRRARFLARRNHALVRRDTGVAVPLGGRRVLPSVSRDAL